MLCRYTVATFEGKELYLAFTVNAMFRINDLLREGEDIMSFLGGRSDFERFCKMVNILAGCGAQVRESEGCSRPAVPAAEELYARMRPVEYIQIRQETINAILAGYGREVVDEEEETDLVLAELEKKESPPGQPF